MILAGSYGERELLYCSVQANETFLQDLGVLWPDRLGLMACRHLGKQQDTERDQRSPVCSKARWVPSWQAPLVIA